MTRWQSLAAPHDSRNRRHLFQRRKEFHSRALENEEMVEWMDLRSRWQSLAARKIPTCVIVSQEFCIQVSPMWVDIAGLGDSGQQPVFPEEGIDGDHTLQKRG